jgi:hypothetical protein
VRFSVPLRTPLVFVCWAAFVLGGYAETVDASLQVHMTRLGKSADQIAGSSGVVVWLTPLSPTTVDFKPKPGHYRLLQKDKTFTPHLLVIPTGSSVDFPNLDPFYHNVFSFFNGKRFDLGLYESGSSRTVHFDHDGVSYIFCNIHPEMSAVVITLATPLYALSNSDGQLGLTAVPYGRYVLHVWSDGMGPETQPLTRSITIGENASSLGVIWVPATNGQSMVHKNMYGREYDEPTPNSSVYEQQR